MMTNVAINLLLHPAGDGRPELSQVSYETRDFFALAAGLAYHAMLVEVHLTPKPGLVDLLTQGAHTDMNVSLFEASADAIRPYLMQFLIAGLQFAGPSADELLTVLRPIGMAAEQAMFAATAGVNTHKGMIFGLGLICGAAGWLWGNGPLRGNGQSVNAQQISRIIQRCCRRLVDHELARDELSPRPLETETHGEALFRKYGLTGARGEAASGYATILHHSLPAYEQAVACGYSIEQALWQTMLVLMAHNEDTNVVSRGGMHGLRFVQTAAESLLASGGCANPDLEVQLVELDTRFSERRLSPGGSADLLAMTWLLAQMNEI